MDPFVKKAGWTNSTLIKVILGALLATGVMGIGGIAVQFSNYKQSGGIPYEGSFPSLVSISTPQNGTQFEAGESQIIEVMAIGQNKFRSIELWLDGKLAGVQTAPEDGINPFSTHFTWLPFEPGAHSLVAGAVDANGQKAMSAQVIVFIVPPKVNIELVKMDLSGSPNVLPAPPEGASDSPAPPEAGATIGPAGGWSGSPGDWLTSLTAKDAPSAPELTASAGRCAANLLIHDLSNNEEGFTVYRQMINSPSWLKVATLSSQSQVEWLEYTDEGVSGGVIYYVSAFNSQGAADSNLQLVNIPIADCGQEGEAIGVGLVDVTLQIPNQEAERVYCYFSTDGTNFARWPQLGFLTFDESGALPNLPVMRVRQSSSGEEPAFPILDLFMDCWGWQGGELTPLGNFSVEGLSPQSNGGQTVEGEGISAKLVSAPIDFTELIPIDPEANMVFDVNLDIFSNNLLPSINPDIARVSLNLVTDPQECINYLPDEAKNPLGALLYCFPYPQYDANKGGTPPQPYLGWTWNPAPKCLGGWSESCLGYPELLKMAEETGGQVGFEIAAFSSKGIHSWMVTEPWLRMFVVPPVSCAGDMQFNVRMWYQPGNEGVAVSASPDSNLMEIDEFILNNIPSNEILYGPYSNPVTIPCQPISVNVGGKILIKQYLDITFDSVYFIFTDDGDDETLELYGYYRVIAPSMGQLQEEHCFLEGLVPCDNELFGEGPYYAYTRRNLLVADWEEDEDLKKFIIKGSYDLRNWELCQSTNKFSCLYEGQATSYMTGNNTLRVFVTEGEALTFEVNLVDYDELSADDVACYATHMTPSRTLEQWAALEDKHVQFGSEWGPSGRCIVVAYINAVNP